jgi:hypothetical protein
MPIFSGPKVTTDGLVFNYDQDNIKSYKGPTIQNLAASIGFNNASSTGISITGGYETVNVPQIGEVSATASVIQNNYNVFSPNSADCCPSPFFYGTGRAVTPSTLYTYAIVYKVLSDYTNANYMYRYEFTSNGGTLVIQQGIHSDSNRIHLGDGWYWAWGTFTTAATTNWIGYHAAYYYRYSSIPDKMWIAKVLLTSGNFTTLHPKYWPNVNTTRSSTQTLFDLSGINTVTATNLTYASNGAFSFDGSTGYLSTPYTQSSPNSFTVESWINSTEHSSDTNIGKIIVMSYSNYNGWIFSLNGTTSLLQLRHHNFNNSTTSYNIASSTGLSLNTWYHLAATDNGTTVRLYVNGVQVASGSSATSTTNSPMTLHVGAWPGAGSAVFFKGQISSAKIYNRALSATEITQNFEAIRGKYGI